MAVPTSNISMLGIARELYYGSYSSSGSITGAISSYDLMNSGNSGGSGLSYPVWDNSPCSSNPPYGPAFSSDFTAITATYYDGTQTPPNVPITVYFITAEWTNGETWVNSLGAQGFESISNLNNPTPLSNQRGTYNYDYTTCANDFVVDGSGRITYTNPTC
jgi:hypothetical protein